MINFKFKNIIKYVFISFLLFVLIGCKKTDPKHDFKEENLTLKVGNTHDISEYDFLDQDIVKYEITSKNKNIAVVVDGVIKALDEGEVVIEVTLKSSNTMVLKITLTVEKEDDIEPLNTKKITYHTNGGNNHPDNKEEYKIDELPITLKDADQAGLDFLGWYDNPDFTGEPITIIDDSFGDTVVLYAYFAEKENNRIIYNLDGGQLSGAQEEYTEADLPLKLTTPTKEGYLFKGWFADSNLTDEITEVPKGTTGLFPVYCKWEKIDEKPNIYTIGYELNGGTISGQLDRFSAEDLPYSLVTPSRSGYNFVGWYTDANFTEKITTIEAGTTKSIIVYAKWEQIPETRYFITYHLNGGVLKDKKESFVPSELPFNLSVPTREGYRFKGWSRTNDPNETNFTTHISKGIAEDVVLYAHWEELAADEFAINYHVDGGNLVNAIEKFTEKDLPLTLPTTITKAGYEFKGWFVDEDFANPISQISKGTKDNVNVYAKWEKIPETEYKIHYVLDGGTLANAKETFVPSELPFNLQTPTKPGYEFLGWYIDEDFANKVDFVSEGIESDIKIYARWKEIKVETYSIIYNLDNGSLANALNSFTEADLPYTLPIPTKANHIFEGWFTEASFTNKVTVINTVGNKVFYAKWKLDVIEPQDFNIEYVLNGGSFGYSKEQLKVDFLTDYHEYLGSSLPLSDFMHGEGKTSGYEGPWAVPSEGTAVIERLYAADQKEADPSLDFFINQPKYHAKWKPFFDLMERLVNEQNPAQHFWSSTYTGNLRLRQYFTGAMFAGIDDLPANFEGGSAPNKYNSAVGVDLVSPTREGYTFGGWFKNANFTGEAISEVTKGTTGNLKLYAYWFKEGETQVYTITYNTDGGSLSGEKTKITASDLPYTLPTPTKSGYIFRGWFTDSAHTKPITVLSNVGNVSVYAKWEKETVPADSYTIAYELDGGALLDAKHRFTADDLPYVLPQPTKAGYSFVGWFTEQSFANKITRIDSTGNKIVYAKWEKLPETRYSILYNLDGGSLANAKQNFVDSELPYTIPIPTKTGYTFIGWYTESSHTNKITIINKGTNKNITLYAKWEKIKQEYNLTYELNGGRFGYNKEQLKIDFLTDYHEFLGSTMKLSDFMHGTGKTSGYEGPWAVPSEGTATIERLYEANKKDVDASSDFFINQPKYHAKWKPFFDLMERLVNEQNPAQHFWSSTYTGNLRLRQYFTGAMFVGIDDLPANFEKVAAPDKYKSDEVTTIPNPERNGYKFAGWYDNKDFKGVVYKNIAKGTAGNIKLYAKWVKNGQNEEFHIEYNLNSGSLSGQKTKFTKNDLPYTLPKPTRSGYIFMGWYSNEGLTTKIDKITKESNHSVYAKWEVDVEYILTYNLDGGSISGHKTKFFASDLPYTLPIPTKADHLFLGWYSDAAKTKEITKIDSVGNHTVYAKWEKIDPNKTYTINYNLNGGSLSNAKTSYKVSELPLTLQTPTRENHKFDGWYLNSNFTGAKLTKIDLTNAGNLTLYAKWQVNDFKVEYELNGGKWSIASKDDLKKDFLTDFYAYVNPSESLTEFMHGKGKTSGYDGTWYSKHIDKLYEANSKHADASLPYFINQPAYNSKWVPFFNMLDKWTTETNPAQDLWGSTWTGFIRIHEYFTGQRWADRNDIPSNLPGISDYQRKYTPDSLPLTLPIPSKSGAVFEGWYENANFSGSKVTSIAKGSTGNKKFYAKWLVKPYNITYVLNGGSWYTSKNNMKNDFLSDFYNFLGKPGGNLTTFRHGAGKTSGYNGTWRDYTNELYSPNDKTENPSKDKFINQIEYNKKWLPFFNYMDTLVKETNPKQSFWGSVYEGTTRLKQYMNEELYSDKKTIPNVVKAPSIYYGGQGLSSLMEPKNGSIKFLGWYDNANFSGSKVTSIPASATGNKTFYAKWDIVAPPKGSVYLRLNYSGNGTLEVGKSVRVTYTAVVTGSSLPADPVKWSSSNTSVATVDQNGNVTAKKAGNVIITAETIASGAKSTVGFTVYASNTNSVLKHLIESNTGVLWSRNIVYYGYQGNYTNRVQNTANKFLADSLPITSMMLTGGKKGSGTAITVRYVTVHDTGSSAASSTARANGGWVLNSGNTNSSWHYTVGNDGIFKHINEGRGAWHAGDGSFTNNNRDTGVKATTLRPTVSRSGGSLYINGKKSNLAATVPITDVGLLFTIGSNGNYYLNQTWVSNYGVICNKGGNYASVGIEMAVNTGSNVYYTWQRTAKLVAGIMSRNNLTIGQVGFHRTFDGKMCPQTLIRSNNVPEFLKMVEVEHALLKSGYSVTFKSHNTSIINNKGQVVKLPTYRTNVEYTVTIKKGSTTHSVKLNALVPGTKDI